MPGSTTHDHMFDHGCGVFQYEQLVLMPFKYVTPICCVPLNYASLWVWVQISKFIKSSWWFLSNMRSAVTVALWFSVMSYTGLGVMTCAIRRELVGAVHFCLLAKYRCDVSRYGKCWRMCTFRAGLKLSYFCFVMSSVSSSHSALVPLSRDRCKITAHVSCGSNSRCLGKCGSAMMIKLREPDRNSRTCVTCNQMCVTEHTSGYVKFW
jgi:hypothetical protein